MIRRRDRLSILVNEKRQAVLMLPYDVSRYSDGVFWV